MNSGSFANGSALWSSMNTYFGGQLLPTANNFTQPMPHCAINVGELKVIFDPTRDWYGQVLDVDKNDGSNIKYKAIIYIKDGLLSAIEKKGLGTGAINVDLSMLFDEDYSEMYDLEDEYGF